MTRYWSIYRVFIKQFFKNILEYRVDFLVGMLSFLLMQTTGILFLLFVFNAIPALDGWTFEQLMVMYGFFQLPRAIDHLFTDNIWMMERYVFDGSFDRFMLRPLNSLFQLVSTKIDTNAIGELVLGIVVLVIYIPQVGITLDGLSILVMVGYVFSGAIIYTAIKLLWSNIAFYAISGGGTNAIMSTAYDMANFGKYPITIYPMGIRLLLTYIFPFAFVSYYPVAYLLGVETSLWFLTLSYIIGIVLFIVAYSIWKLHLKKYNSIGN